MPKFLYFGQTVESNIPLPELLSVDYASKDVIFRVWHPRHQLNDPCWTRYWLSSGGEKTILYCKKGHDHWLRFPGLADFCISQNAEEISCFPTQRLPQETIRHLFLDQVFPRCLAHQGKLIVHASAVLLEQGVTIFVGSSGSGKSTMAGSFHQAGYRAISDDSVWLKENNAQIRAVPSYDGIRLWEDSVIALFDAGKDSPRMAHYSTKKRISINDNDWLKMESSFPILSVIVLASPSSQASDLNVKLDLLPFREAFVDIANETFQLDSFDYPERHLHMKMLGSIVTAVPVFRLSMPRDYDLLPVVRQKILEAVL